MEDLKNKSLLLIAKMETILRNEEVYWKQKGKDKWIREWKHTIFP